MTKLRAWCVVLWCMLDSLLGGARLGVGPAPEREPFHPARWPGHVFPFACVAAVLGSIGADGEVILLSSAFLFDWVRKWG